jgi:hypothetical protein
MASGRPNASGGWRRRCANLKPNKRRGKARTKAVERSAKWNCWVCRFGVTFIITGKHQRASVAERPVVLPLEKRGSLLCQSSKNFTPTLSRA